MLHTQTVIPPLLEILKGLMTHEMFNPFLLVGGTSLALQIGHRQSIDIDLFGRKELDELEISSFLGNIGEVRILKKSKNILIYSVNGVKVDFVNYNYPWLKEPLVLDNYRLASKEDIGAMKLNAISGRGSKKDFIDLYFLLKEFRLDELFGFYNQKFKDGSDFLVLKSLTYFEDADMDDMPKMEQAVDWEEVKSEVGKRVKEYMRQKTA